MSSIPFLSKVKQELQDQQPSLLNRDGNSNMYERERDRSKEQMGVSSKSDCKCLCQCLRQYPSQGLQSPASLSTIARMKATAYLSNSNVAGVKNAGVESASSEIQNTPAVETNTAKKEITSEVNKNYIEVRTIKQGKVVFEFLKFNGIKVTDNGFKCILCISSWLTKNKVHEHIGTTKHMDIVKNAVEDDNGIRQILNLWYHCVVCNIIFIKGNKHLDNAEHKKNMDSRIKTTKDLNNVILDDIVEDNATVSEFAVEINDTVLFLDLKSMPYCDICDVYHTKTKENHELSARHKKTALLLAKPVNIDVNNDINNNVGDKSVKVDRVEFNIEDNSNVQCANIELDKQLPVTKEIVTEQENVADKNGIEDSNHITKDVGLNTECYTESEYESDNELPNSKRRKLSHETPSDLDKNYPTTERESPVTTREMLTEVKSEICANCDCKVAENDKEMHVCEWRHNYFQKYPQSDKVFTKKPHLSKRTGSMLQNLPKTVDIVTIDLTGSDDEEDKTTGKVNNKDNTAATKGKEMNKVVVATEPNTIFDRQGYYCEICKIEVPRGNMNEHAQNSKHKELGQKRLKEMCERSGIDKNNDKNKENKDGKSVGEAKGTNQVIAKQIDRITTNNKQVGAVATQKTISVSAKTTTMDKNVTKNVTMPSKTNMFQKNTPKRVAIENKQNIVKQSVAGTNKATVSNSPKPKITLIDITKLTGNAIPTTSKRQLNSTIVHCETCGVKVSLGNLKEHNNGRRHVVLTRSKNRCKSNNNVSEINKTVSLQNGAGQKQNGAGGKENGAAKQDGVDKTQNGVAKIQNGVDKTQNGVDKTQNGVDKTQNGTKLETVNKNPSLKRKRDNRTFVVVKTRQGESLKLPKDNVHSIFYYNMNGNRNFSCEYCMVFFDMKYFYQHINDPSHLRIVNEQFYDRNCLKDCVNGLVHCAVCNCVVFNWQGHVHDYNHKWNMKRSLLQ